MTGYMPAKDTACLGIAWLLQCRCHPDALSCEEIYAVQVDADMMAYTDISTLLQQQLHCGGVAVPSC